MNAQATRASIDGPGQLRVEESTVSRGRIAGVVIQLLMIYLVSRDLLVPGLILSSFVPITNAVQVRSAVAMLVALIAIRGRGLAGNFSGFGHWAWILLGPFGLILVIEGIITVGGDEALIPSGAPKTMVIVFVNAIIVLFAVGVLYLFAAKELKPKAVLRFLLQPYCYFAIYISATGLAAWLLVVSGVVQSDEWLLVGVVQKWDLVAASGSFYQMPYYLGLIAHESIGSLFGLDFGRATGLFQVPASAAFYVTPALFLIPLVIDLRSHKWQMGLVYLALLGFLFAVQSATNLVVLGPIAAIFLGRLVLTGAWRGRLLAPVAIIVVGGVLFASASGGTLGLKWNIRGLDYVDTVVRTVDGGSFLGPGYFQPQDAPVGLLSSMAIFGHVGLVALLGLAMMLSRSPHWYVGGSMMYVGLAAVKKLGQHLTMGIYIYMLVIFALALACYWNESRTRKKPPPWQRQKTPFNARIP